VAGAGLFNRTDVRQMIHNLSQVAAASMGKVEGFRNLAQRKGMTVGG
jgi:hypothetical protein